MLRTGAEKWTCKVIPKVLCIMGIIGVSPAVRTKNQDLDNLKAVCKKHMNDIGVDEYKTFKIETKRSNKNIPLSQGRFQRRSLNIS